MYVYFPKIYLMINILKNLNSANECFFFISCILLTMNFFLPDDNFVLLLPVILMLKDTLSF